MRDFMQIMAYTFTGMEVRTFLTPGLQMLIPSFPLAYMMSIQVFTRPIPLLQSNSLIYFRFGLLRPFQPLGSMDYSVLMRCSAFYPWAYFTACAVLLSRCLMLLLQRFFWHSIPVNYGYPGLPLLKF